MTKLSPWHVLTDKRSLRRLGKAQEELGELQAVLARCIIQGINEVDPSSGELNRDRLQDEVADVWAQLCMLQSHYEFDTTYILSRVGDKVDQMHQWDLLVQHNDEPEDSSWTYSNDSDWENSTC